ncbi:Uncharacterized protein APZ42_030188 [Daphnia magna]|uniref:Uncharacterized protein n=1 Tax=Daphnia magna TaxID=35525 RepID=A0A164NZU0_9CRUS|nr:Uncharacterized protein APZ42_030188 [Daphnia magna]
MTVATAFDNTPRLVSSGEGALIKTSTPGIFRLMTRNSNCHFILSQKTNPSQLHANHKNESFKKNTTVTAIEQLLNSQVGLAAHVQFVRKKLTEQENDVLRIVRNTQCKLIRTKRALAISVAQYDRWLAASILQFPECMIFKHKKDCTIEAM